MRRLGPAQRRWFAVLLGTLLVYAAVFGYAWTTGVWEHACAAPGTWYHGLKILEVVICSRTMLAHGGFGVFLFAIYWIAFVVFLWTAVRRPARFSS